MRKTIVLINCQLDSESSIIKQLKNIEGVTSVQQTFGAYDIICEVEANREDQLSKITWKVRKLEGIRSTVDLIVVNKNG